MAMRERATKREHWIPFGFWAVYALVRLGAGLRGDRLAMGNDDMARLVQVRQWLAGQSWFDLTQYRLNPPTGVAMHWTRHTDVLLAALTSISGSETFALVVLPLLLALVAYFLIAAIARHLGGPSAVPAALLLFLASALAAQQFAPGRIDHHGLQIVLLLVSVLGLLRFDEPRWALLAGASAGVSLSIGLEQLLSVVGVITVAGLVAVKRDDGGVAARRFGVGLVAGSAISALAFAPPSRLVETACDVFSLPHLVAITVSGVTLTLVHRFRHRLGVLLVGGVVAATAALSVAPRCVDPYADVDPLLRRLWLANVAEAQGIGSMLRHDSGYGMALLVPALVGTAYAVYRWRAAGWGTGPWFRLTIVMGVGYGVALFQFRGASAATALSVPALGVLFARMRDRLAAWPMLGRVGVMLVVALVISGLGPLLVGVALQADGTPARGTEIEDCSVGVDALEGLQGLVLAPMDLGPDLLIGTEAEVLAAPYHRNNQGNLLAWDLLMGPPEEADFSRYGIDWVVTCEGMNENSLIVGEAPAGLLAGLLEGQVPASLEETDLGGGGLSVYRVTD